MTPNEYVFRTTDPALAARFAQTALDYENGRGAVSGNDSVAGPQEGGKRPYDFIATYEGVKYKGSVPHGTPLRHVYKGLMLEATVDDGGVNFDGVRYADGNEAAHVAGLTKDPKCTRPNAPWWWQMEVAPGVWQPIFKIAKVV